MLIDASKADVGLIKVTEDLNCLLHSIDRYFLSDQNNAKRIAGKIFPYLSEFAEITDEIDQNNGRIIRKNNFKFMELSLLVRYYRSVI